MIGLQSFLRRFIMKQYFRGVIILLAVILFAGVSYGADKPLEKVLDQKIPVEWGTLKTVIQFPNLDLIYYYFEDSKGTIRRAAFDQSNNALYGATLVIERSK
jgi:hypothetical protein